MGKRESTVQKALQISLSLMAAALVGCCAFGWAAPPAEKPEHTTVVLFARHYLDPIYLEDVPAPEEINAPIAIAAARGEFEPAGLGVHATAPTTVAVSCSQLVAQGGTKIGTENIDIRTTRYIDSKARDAKGLPKWSSYRWQRPKGKTLDPSFLDSPRPVSMAAGTSRQYWITVHVPEDAAPGQYRGSVKVAPADSEPATLPISVEVYPFALHEVRPALFVAGDSAPIGKQGTLAASNFALSKSHGMNTILVERQWPCDPDMTYQDGKFQYPNLASRVGDVIAAAQKYGLAGDRPVVVWMYWLMAESCPAALRKAGVGSPLLAYSKDIYENYNNLYAVFRPIPEKPPAEQRRKRLLPEMGPYYPAKNPWSLPTTEFGRLLFKGWVDALKVLDNARKEKGWPALYHWLIDEPHQSRGSARLAMVMLRAAEQAGALSFLTCNEPSVSEPDPDKLWNRALTDALGEVIEPALIFEPYLNVRCYNNKYVGTATLERARKAGDVYGTYVNIYGNEPASVRYQAGYIAWKNDLDFVMFWHFGPAHDVSPDGSLNFLREWEAMREGVDDLKYLTTLRDLIREGKGTPRARAAARRTLEAVTGDIVDSLDKIGHADSETGKWIAGNGSGLPSRCDAARRNIARAILSLLGT